MSEVEEDEREDRKYKQRYRELQVETIRSPEGNLGFSEEIESDYNENETESGALENAIRDAREERFRVFLRELPRFVRERLKGIFSPEEIEIIEGKLVCVIEGLNVKA